MDRIDTLSDTKDTRGDGYRVVVYTVADTDRGTYKLLTKKRFQALKCGDWQYLGICVDIYRIVGRPANTYIVGHASLWGIESDSGADYFADVARDLTQEAWNEVVQLREALADGVMA